MARKQPAPTGSLDALTPEVMRLALEHSPGPVLMIAADGTIQYLNAAAMVALGFTREQLLGTPLLELIARESRAAASQLLAEAAGGVTGVVELWQRGGAGQPLLLAYQGLPAGGAASGAVLLLGQPLAQDSRRLEALLERSGQLQAVLDSINAGVLLIDGGGIVRYATRRLGDIFQLDVSSWPGCRRDELALPELHPVPQREPIGEGELLEQEAPQRRFLRRFTDQVYDAQGAHIGEIEVYTDVTELQHMSRLKDEFVAAAAHDLKTPVTALKGFSQIALRMAQRLNDAPLLHQLEMINARSDDLAYLMDSLLDVSRIQAGRLRLELSSFSLDKLLNKVIHHFAFDLRRHPRPLTIVALPEPLTVTWDRARCERLLINLIGNAMKYSPPGSAIDLRVMEPAGHGEAQGLDVLLAVSDHGIGIRPEQRAHVFDRFYRSPDVVEHGYKGTGLGLYIARYVVELHGGHIWVADAIHGGQGTTVFVALPREVRGG